MSLINDALKRANQTKPPTSDATGPMLRTLEPAPAEPSGPPQWLLFVFPVALLLVCGIAGVLLYKGFKRPGESLGGLTASARTPEPKPAAPSQSSNDVVTVPPVVAAPTNTTGTVVVASSEPTFPELKLQGVFYRPSNPSAFINGKSVYRGDKIDNARVISIAKDSVTVECNGERKVLTMH
jgi:hypothetical protein